MTGNLEAAAGDAARRGDGGRRGPAYVSPALPQGGVVSPLLCNVYLDRLDRAWETERLRDAGALADDLLVMCRSRAEAERALDRLTAVWPTWAWSRRRPRPGSCTWRWEARALISSASITAWCAPGAALGTACRLPRPLALTPGGAACPRPHPCSHELRARLLSPVEDVVQDFNLSCAAGPGIFRFGNSARSFDKIMSYAVMRFAMFIAKLHSRSRRYGWFA